jgi:hypothetical protein
MMTGPGDWEQEEERLAAIATIGNRDGVRAVLSQPQAHRSGGSGT